ncbi:hypothetical protein A3L23_02073 [Rhodococcoides fascians D188]|nr:hypothetical protein A3L23_02073 [Rhodococcus fascians D188]
MPLTSDPYETEDAPDHAGATADVAEGETTNPSIPEGTDRS